MEALSQRVQAIGESPTLAVDAKAKLLRAAGEPVIGFGAGEPDFPTPAHIVEAAARACADPAAHRYSPAAGLPDLRAAIAERTRASAAIDARPEMVVVTNGAKHALYATFQALLDPGDEVIVVAPYWVTYPEQIRFAGAEPVVVATTGEQRFRVSVEQLEAARTSRTKALLFVSPSNPTGCVYPPEEVEAIGRWAATAGIWVVTDEIYQHLVYGDATFASMPAAVPEIADRCIVVDGVAKTYAMTGWRVGWIVAPPAVAGAITRLQSHLTSNVCNVAQAAALAALTGPQDAVASMRDAFDRRRKIALERLAAIDGVECVEPQGAFYTFPSFEGVLGRELGGRHVGTTLELAEVLLDTVKVALVPGEGFGAPGYARIGYALGDDDLAEGLDRIANLLA